MHGQHRKIRSCKVADGSIIGDWLVHDAATETVPHPSAINSDRAQAHRFLQYVKQLTCAFAKFFCESREQFAAMTQPMSPGCLSPTATLFIESWFGSGLQYRHDFLATLFSVCNLEIQIGVDCPDPYASCGLLAHRNRHESPQFLHSEIEISLAKC
jgi:hypothetical protein